MTLLLFLAIGLVAGLCSGIFGIGGGVLIVPALMLLARFPPHTATGTSLGALLLPVGALGAWEYYQKGHVEVTAAILLALGLAIGAGIGARFALTLDPMTVRRSFAVFLVLIAVRMWFQK